MFLSPLSSLCFSLLSPPYTLGYMGGEVCSPALIFLPAGRGPTALCRSSCHSHSLHFFLLLCTFLLLSLAPPPLSVSPSLPAFSTLLLSLCVLACRAFSRFPGMKERASFSLARCSKVGISALENDVADLYLPVCEEDVDQHKARDFSDPPKPFAAFGSFQQRHGEMLECIDPRSVEAPAKLESAACIPRESLSQEFSFHHNEGNGGLNMVSMDCVRLDSLQSFKLPHPHRKLYKSFSTDLDREEAWERKKEQCLLEEEDNDTDDGEEYDADEGLYEESCEKAIAEENSSGSDDGGELYNKEDNVRHAFEHGESITDGAYLDADHADEEHLCSPQEDGIQKTSKRMPSSRKKAFTRRPFKPFIRTRTKSLTDEDMEELRGSIDLGFGFRFSEHCNLKSTLPALELYYAINKNYVDAQSRSSPVSPLEGNALVRTNSAGSALSPSSETWRIASPGDHPSQVKTRLRHWAQAVACSVKQGY